MVVELTIQLFPRMREGSRNRARVIAMGLHERYGLTKVINTRGTFTPLGVSRSSAAVGAAVAEALGEFFVVDELQDLAGHVIARDTGAESGCVTHCARAAITLAVAAAMTRGEPDKVAALPDTTGMRNAVVLPAGHAIDYGHPIVTDIRLAGAVPVIAGTGDVCAAEDLDRALARDDAACLLLVSSRLVRGTAPPLAEAVAAAHRRGLAAIIDAAAQDLRIAELLATGADLVLVSGQKYLASPTAGLAIGRRVWVDALRAQEKGIGRAMKATKEAILGALAALDERRGLDLAAWSAAQAAKVARFVERANRLRGIRASAAPDPTGLPFPRASLVVDAAAAGRDARALSDALHGGSPAIWLMDHAVARGELILELVPLSEAEIETILERLSALLPAVR
jgi:L-seryl-tRNA(Ser) seleniumtransferase